MENDIEIDGTYDEVFKWEYYLRFFQILVDLRGFELDALQPKATAAN